MMGGDGVIGFETECLHDGWWLALTPRDEFSERPHTALRGVLIMTGWKKR